VTLGLATYPQDAAGGLELLDCADRAMYLGKQQGGNCLKTTTDRDAARPEPS
jgi:GGDEF domain-containing protein